jgi:hypothetical protein
MSTILIRSKDKGNDKFLLELAKRLRLQAKVLNEDDEQDLLLIKAIDEGIKSGEGSSDEVKKIFGRHGVKI